MSSKSAWSGTGSSGQRRPPQPPYASGTGSRAVIDVGFDVRTDAGGGDPDRYSATLRRYHQLLWSKPLPSGEMFDLDADLHHASDLGEFWLSSDSIVHTYSTWQQPARLVQVVQQVPQTEVTAFNDLACTVGGYLVFPMQVHVDGRWRRSINQSRGFHPRIRDRFDLTLECIRRHYEGTPSPLDGTLAWYADFFGLFGDFGGYVDHFLLQDLVEDGQGWGVEELRYGVMDAVEAIRLIRDRRSEIALFNDDFVDWLLQDAATALGLEPSDSTPQAA